MFLNHSIFQSFSTMIWNLVLSIFLVEFAYTTSQFTVAPLSVNITSGFNNLISTDLFAECTKLLIKLVESAAIDIIFINVRHETSEPGTKVGENRAQANHLLDLQQRMTFASMVAVQTNATKIKSLTTLLLADDYENHPLIFFVTFHSDETSFLETIEAKNCAYFHVWPEILTEGQENNALAQIRRSFDHISPQNLQMNSDSSCVLRKISGQTAWKGLRNKISRRSNFQGAVIRAIAGDDPDYGLEAKFVEDKTLDVLKSGSAVEMFWVLRDTLNFTVKAIRGTWGESSENGSLGGLVTETINGQADICISLMPLAVQSGPVKLSYLQPTEVDIIRAFFVQPSSSAVRDIFLSTYSISLRCVIVLIILGMPLILRFVIWRQTKRGGWFRFIETDLADESFLWSLATFCQQGWHTTPHFVSTKIVFTVGYFTALICYVAFSAGIVSKLSVEIQPISNFEDLIRFDYMLYADKDTIPYQHILPDALYRSFTSNKKISPIDQNTPNSKSVEDDGGMDLTRAFNKIVKTKSALLSYDDVILMSSKNINAEKLLCNVISSLPATKKDVPFSMIVKQNSPYREFFNSKIMLMKERGLNRRFDMLYNDGVKLTCEENTNKKKQLGLSDLFSAFSVISVGFLASCFILVAERICNVGFSQKQKMRQRK